MPLFDSIQVNFFKYLGIGLKNLSKTTKKGNGTSLPGLIVEKNCPQLVKLLAKNYKHIILITGTNGKTTTRGIICHLLKNNGYKVCTNQGGANILRGIVSTLLSNLDFNNQPKNNYLVLEVEEATMPILTKYLTPNQIILTNIFRDQMDAYGEINQTLEYFHTAINNSLTHNSDLEILVNGDDTKLTNFLNQKNYSNLINYFGIDSDNQIQYESPDEISEIDDHRIIKAKCLSSDFANQVFESTDKKYLLPETTLNLSGAYNLYNAWSSILAVKDILSAKQIQESLPKFGAIFGRGEIINIQNKKITLFLVKNPAGFDQILQTINQTNNETNQKSKKIGLVFSINDNIADGKDVSWLWDVNFEKYYLGLQTNFEKFVTSGSRGLDMLLRLEITGFKNLTIQDNYQSNSSDLLNYILNSNPETVDWIICSTYTATLEIRNEISKIVPLKSIDSQEY